MDKYKWKNIKWSNIRMDKYKLPYRNKNEKRNKMAVLTVWLHYSRPS